MLGVGLIGCGEAAQAIHLPALASLPELFRVAHCMDADAAVAETVADRAGARRWTTDVEALLRDPDVDVVCIASPNRVHGRQLVAACRAGKKGVLVEKPFAATAAEARAVAAIASEHGTKVVVDTMHAYDPAFALAREMWEELPARALVARATTFVGGNPIMVDAQTQPVRGRRAPPRIDDRFTDLAAVMSIVGPDASRGALAIWGWLTGLASHDLPLVRLAFGDVDAVEHVRSLGRAGYDLVLRCRETAVHVTAVWVETRELDWSFEIVAPDARVRVDFPPSYLSSVSARAVRIDASGEHVAPLVRETGYRRAWRDLHRAVTEDEHTEHGPDGAVADLELSERILRVACGLPEHRPDADRPALVCLGAGVWSSVHLGLAAGRTRVHRVASRTLASAESRAFPLGAHASAFGPSALDGAEAAVVCGVPAVHAEHAIAALERGVPVLVEKPLARTVGEARRIASAAAHGTRCVYAENWAYQPGVRAALDALAGRDIRAVRVVAHWPPPAWGSFLEPDYGGGVLFDAGPHPIELARLLLGRPRAEWVRAVLQGEPVDLEASVEIGFAGDRVAQVEATWTARGMTVFAEGTTASTGGRVGLRPPDGASDQIGDGFRLELSPAERLVVDGEEIALPPAPRTLGGGFAVAGYAAQIDALLGEGPVHAGAEDGLAVMEIIAAAYRSAGTGERERLPFTGDPDASPHELWKHARR